MTAENARNSIRVTFISQWFPPEPAIVPANIHDALSEHFEVTVLTGQPNYPHGKVFAGYQSTGRSTRSEEGRTVRRTPLYPSHSNSALGRIANYCSWAATASFYGSRTVSQSDINFVYASPILAALPAMLARVTHGVPFVLNIQDLWPDSIFATGFLKKGAVHKLASIAIGSFAKVAYKMSSGVITISPGMEDILADRGVPREKIHLIYNWADESVFFPVANRTANLRSRLDLSEKGKLLVYAGNIGPAQELHNVIEALSTLKREGRLVHLVLVGDGVELERISILSASLEVEDRVHFIGRVSPSEVPEFLTEADASLVSLGGSELFQHTMPSKVQSILACASPIFVIGEGDVANIARQTGAGWAASPNSRESLERELRSFADSTRSKTLGQSARETYVNHMGRSVGVKRLVSMLADLADPQRG